LISPENPIDLAPVLEEQSACPSGARSIWLFVAIDLFSVSHTPNGSGLVSLDPLGESWIAAQLASRRQRGLMLASTGR